MTVSVPYIYLRVSWLIDSAADTYMNAVTDGSNAALRTRPGGSLPASTVIDAPDSHVAEEVQDKHMSLGPYNTNTLAYLSLRL